MNVSQTFSIHKIQLYLKNFIIYSLIIAGAAITALPFLWMFFSSFKGTVDIVAIPMRFFPTEWKFSNYPYVWEIMPFTRFYLNSIIISTLTTIGVLIVSSLGAYSFARINFWGKNVFFMLYLGTIMIPQVVTIIPIFLIIKNLGWLNSYQGLIIPGLANAMSTFLLRQFFLSIPKDLEDAAFIDGANRFQIYSRIFVPLAKPALLTVGLMVFMASWNSLLMPLIIMSKTEMQTLPLGLARLALSGGWVRIEWGPVMAATLLTILPIIILYAFLQNYFIRGIVLTGLK